MSHETFIGTLHAWQGFYSLVGSAAATLTGLMFVATSLGARVIEEADGPKVRTFITPTVIYFSLSILISALMNVPTQTRLSLTFEMAALGLVCAGYSVSHLPRLRDFNVDGSVERQVGGCCSAAKCSRYRAERGGGRCPTAGHDRPA